MATRHVREWKLTIVNRCRLVRAAGWMISMNGHIGAVEITDATTGLHDSDPAKEGARRGGTGEGAAGNMQYQESAFDEG